MDVPISEAPKTEIEPLLPGIIKIGWYLVEGETRIWVKEIVSLSVGFNCLVSCSSW